MKMNLIDYKNFTVTIIPGISPKAQFQIGLQAFCTKFLNNALSIHLVQEVVLPLDSVNLFLLEFDIGGQYPGTIYPECQAPSYILGHRGGNSIFNIP